MPTWAETTLAWMSAGAGGGIGFFMLRWLMEFFGGRYDKRADLIDRGIENLIGHLEGQVKALLERVEAVETELALCKTNHSASEQELARLRGIVQGTGDARQIAQLIIAKEKENGK